MSIPSDTNPAPSPTYDNGDEEIINWEEEAAAIIRDVNPHVALIEISRQLPNNESKVYLNVRTIEGQEYCVQVSSIGFRVVANRFDTIDADKNEVSEDEGEVYETPYSLLNKISPSYVESFGNQLCKQLLSVQQMRTQFNEEDEEGADEDDSECTKESL
ncbi:PREDICTED: GSK3-beta interaction protein-like [Rhagoletis zephyria]|uniref:GSK3-beta interaction protein-like n=1 Tax=Rhagoletis zephyria TaxID=28612 RepID=UPI00081180A9|nr:PREDICTED: GSK3-beta interaction protein-like [Rhagoletis zephyria]